MGPVALPIPWGPERHLGARQVSRPGLPVLAGPSRSSEAPVADLATPGCAAVRSGQTSFPEEAPAGPWPLPRGPKGLARCGVCGQGLGVCGGRRQGPGGAAGLDRAQTVRSMFTRQPARTGYTTVDKAGNGGRASAGGGQGWRGRAGPAPGAKARPEWTGPGRRQVRRSRGGTHRGASARCAAQSRFRRRRSRRRPRVSMVEPARPDAPSPEASMAAEGRPPGSPRRPRASLRPCVCALPSSRGTAPLGAGGGRARGRAGRAPGPRVRDRPRLLPPGLALQGPRAVDCEMKPDVGSSKAIDVPSAEH